MFLALKHKSKHYTQTNKPLSRVFKLIESHPAALPEGRASTIFTEYKYKPWSPTSCQYILDNILLCKERPLFVLAHWSNLIWWDIPLIPLAFSVLLLNTGSICSRFHEKILFSHFSIHACCSSYLCISNICIKWFWEKSHFACKLPIPKTLIWTNPFRQQFQARGKNRE